MTQTHYHGSPTLAIAQIVAKDHGRVSEAAPRRGGRALGSDLFSARIGRVSLRSDERANPHSLRVAKTPEEEGV